MVAIIALMQQNQIYSSENRRAPLLLIGDIKKKSKLINLFGKINKPFNTSFSLGFLRTSSLDGLAAMPNQHFFAWPWMPRDIKG